MKYISKNDNITALDLSTRSVNCLRRAGIYSVGNLLDFPSDGLESIKKLGTKSAAEIENVLSRIKDDGGSCLMLAETRGELDTPHRDAKKICSLLQSAAQCLAKGLGDSSDAWLKEVASAVNAANGVTEDTVIKIVYSSECVREKIKKSLLKCIELYDGRVSLSVLQNLLPEQLRGAKTFDSLVGEMEDEGTVAVEGGLVCRKYPSILECICRIKSEQEKTLLFARLSGKTLEEAGREFGLTRESVRVKIKRAIKSLPRVEEDKYQYLIENYNISLQDFQIAFEEPGTTYYYLQESYLHSSGGKKIAKKRNNIQGVLKDKNISPQMRKQVEKAILKDFVFVNGVFLKKIRPILIKYYAKNFCTEPVRYDDFARSYNAWLNELGVSGGESVEPDNKGVLGRLFKSNFTIWSLGKTFRYYNIGSREYSELLEAINLPAYENLEISTLKLFREHRGLMERYDIRNEYELHNLLKKIMPEDSSAVKFGRMPNIEIGTVDREKQLHDFLLTHSPITAERASEEYEKAFGIKAATFVANYLPIVEKYLYKGEYNLGRNNLTKKEIAEMRELLPGKFYAIEHIKNTYLRHFPKGNADDINPRALKSMGFIISCGFALSDKYSSATDYFVNLFTASDSFDIRNISREERSHPVYTSTLFKLRAKREIVEVEPHKYINIRVLNKSGFSCEDLEDYCKKVNKSVKEGEYFTVRSLRRNGFDHPLHHLKRDDWFYSSILSEDKTNFRFARTCNTRLLRKGKHPASITDVLVNVLDTRENINLLDVSPLLFDLYGMTVDKYDLLKYIDAAGLYLDRKTKTVFASEADYFRNK